MKRNYLTQEILNYIKKIGNKELVSKILNLDKAYNNLYKNESEYLTLVRVALRWFTENEIKFLYKHASQKENENSTLKIYLSLIYIDYTQLLNINLREEPLSYLSEYEGAFDTKITLRSGRMYY